MNDNIFHIIDQIVGLKGTVVNRALPSLHGGDLKLRFFKVPRLLDLKVRRLLVFKVPRLLVLKVLRLFSLLSLLIS